MTAPAPPPVYAPHRRLTLSGSLGTATPEGFSFGVALDETLFSAATDPEVLADIVTDCTAFFSRPGTSIHPQAVLRQVKVAKIGADGKYVADPLVQDGLAVPGGGMVSVLPPFQVSAAVSLGSDRRGASGRGRFFLPLPAGQIQGDGLWTVDFATSMRISCATWLADLNNRPGIDPAGSFVVIASGKGFLSPVTTVRTGRAPDTIRTRRRQLDERYTEAQVVP